MPSLQGAKTCAKCVSLVLMLTAGMVVSSEEGVLPSSSSRKYRCVFLPCMHEWGIMHQRFVKRSCVRCICLMSCTVCGAYATGAHICRLGKSR